MTAAVEEDNIVAVVDNIALVADIAEVAHNMAD